MFSESQSQWQSQCQTQSCRACVRRYLRLLYSYQISQADVRCEGE